MSVPLVGLISSYREGRLVADAAASLLEACDQVIVLEGPIGQVGEGGEPSLFYDGKRAPSRLLVTTRRTPFATDAAKRTALLQMAQTLIETRQRQPAWWAVILDGDEVLLWPRLLRSYLARASADDAAGAMKIKLVQAGDGRSEVQETGARLLPGHLVESYVLSSMQIKLRGFSTVVTLPNGQAERPPLQGEPHILHRAYLRPPDRTDRQSEAERRLLVAEGFHHLEVVPALLGEARREVRDR